MAARIDPGHAGNAISTPHIVNISFAKSSGTEQYSHIRLTWQFRSIVWLVEGKFRYAANRYTNCLSSQ